MSYATGAYDDEQTVAAGLFAIARAIDRIGTGNAATEMGAIELLAKEVRDGFELIAAAIENRT